MKVKHTQFLVSNKLMCFKSHCACLFHAVGNTQGFVLSFGESHTLLIITTQSLEGLLSKGAGLRNVGLCPCFQDIWRTFPGKLKEQGICFLSVASSNTCNILELKDLHL